jgi:signal peptidase I
MTFANDERTDLKLSLALDVLRSEGEARLTVGGGSMLPSIWPGDILDICRVHAAQLSLGDIVVFAREQRLVVHRVVGMSRVRDEIVLTTRGDRSPRADGPVPAREVLGKVRSIKRGQRNFIPRVACWAQIASWFLLRSEFCTCILLRLSMIRMIHRNPLTLDSV